MKKRLLFLWLAICAATVMHAKSVVFVLADGTEVYYLIDNNPVMKWADGNITVDLDNYTVEGIDRFYLSETDDPSAVESLVAQAGLQFDGNNIVVKAGGNQVKIYSADGKLIDARQSSGGGYVAVDTSALPRGVYIVSVGKSSMKFLKK